MKFKKQFVTILSVLLLVSNSGLAFNAVFCCKNLIAISNSEQSIADCHTFKKVLANCCDILTENESCCSTKKIDIKPNVDQSIIKEVQTTVESCIQSEIVNFLWTFSDFQVQVKTQISAYLCEQNSLPLYKLLCCFVTYG